MLELPEIINRLPEVDMPFPSSTIKTGLLSSPHGQLLFVQAFEDVEIPPHSHKAQWGTVIEGQVELTVSGTTTIHTKGSTYFIPAGAVHGGIFRAGTVAIEYFEDIDRHKPRR